MTEIADIRLPHISIYVVSSPRISRRRSAALAQLKVEIGWTINVDALVIRVAVSVIIRKAAHT